MLLYLHTARTTARQGIIIDPTEAHHERDLSLAEDLHLHLLTAVDTHLHADRRSGIGAMRVATLCETAAPRSSSVASTQPMDHESVISFGEHSVVAWSTPGHSANCLSLVLGDRSAVFTGDTLHARSCGRSVWCYAAELLCYTVSWLDRSFP
jgi:sulfur dioxygenase